jgi:hypothetical protein
MSVWLLELHFLIVKTSYKHWIQQEQWLVLRVIRGKEQDVKRDGEVKELRYQEKGRTRERI